jgi:hypothetical protein
MTETSEEIRILALPEKCTKLPVPIVMLRQRYLLNLIQKDLFTVGIVFLITGHPEKTADTKPEFHFVSTRSVSLFKRTCTLLF